MLNLDPFDRAGKALCSFETIVDLIWNVRTAARLSVKAKLDKRLYLNDVQITKTWLEALSLTGDEFQGDWNYALHPRATASPRT